MAGSHVDHELGDFTADTRLLVLVPMAAVVGAMGAVIALVLVWLIGAITNLVYYHKLASALVSPGANALGWWAVPIPIVGGVIVGLIIRFGTDKIRGHGIPEAIEAILIGGSRMDGRVAILKPIASAIAIGTGGPFGAEGPIIMTGGACGSLFGQAFHLTAAERKTLLVAGAAAGMAAIFATPLAAVLIAVELLLFEWKPRSFVPVATAAIVAAVLRVPLLGTGPIFPMTTAAAPGTREMVEFLAVGVAAGLASVVLTTAVYAAEDLFRKLPVHFMWWPALAGIVVGVGGMIDPRALGVGYDIIRELLGGQLGALVLGLLITKAVIWAVALGSGTSGGVLAPLLIIGGALGAVEAGWMDAADPGVWAAISMAAVMGGTMRSPLTAVVFLLEATHDIVLLPALLVACVAAHTVTVLLMRRSILTEKVARRGHHVSSEFSVSPFSRFRVEDVMERDVPTLPAHMHVDSMLRRLLDHDPVLGRRQGWPIVDDDGALVGVVTRGDLVRALDSDDENESTILDAGTRSPVVAYPDELLEDALHRLARHEFGRLPVVSRDDPTHLIGMLGRQAISAAYEAALEEENVREPGALSLALARFRRRTQRAGATKPRRNRIDATTPAPQPAAGHSTESLS